MSANPAKPSPLGTASTSSSAFSAGTVVFVLFKHKWLIILAALLGLGGAAGYYFLSKPVFVSEAKILVIYVINRDAVDNVESTSSVAGAGGDSVVKSEIEILKSRDLAKKVVGKIGAERFLNSGDPASDAVSMITNGLTATAEKGSDVIGITYQHSDPELARRVLEELVPEYFLMSLQIHRDTESLPKIKSEVAASSTALGNLDADLKKLKMGSNLPLAQLTAGLEAEMAKVKAELEAAKLAFAEQTAWVNEVKKFTSGGGAPVENIAAPVAPEPDRTGPAAALQPGETVRTAVPAAEIPARDNKIVSEYQSVLLKLSVLQASSGTLLKFAPENQQVKDYELRLGSLQNQRLDMETKYPYLRETQTQVPGAPAQGPRVDLLSEQGKLASIEARIKSLEPLLASIGVKMQQLTNDAPAIAKKEREREVEQKNFDRLAISQAKGESNVMVPSQKMPGLGVIQEATPAKTDPGKRTKIALGIAAGGPVLGTVLVLVFGLFLNRTIKRPAELEEHLGGPLLMTIPFFSGRARRRLGRGRSALGDGKSSKAALSLSTPWREGHFIRPFADSIRDRLGLYFDRNNLRHKPKLIGVTGFFQGAGVSTIAGGLAAALSEVGEGRVLLVDMNVSNGKAHTFSEGLPVISLQNALKRDGELLSTTENLYLARAETAVPGAGSLLLKKLFELLPNLKASDFDYMIFDLPPLGQTSPAAAMGGLMDMVLMVVEAEANSREEVKRGYRDLIASGAHVSTVFNKARAYGPQALVGGV